MNVLLFVTAAAGAMLAQGDTAGASTQAPVTGTRAPTQVPVAVRHRVFVTPNFEPRITERSPKTSRTMKINVSSASPRGGRSHK